jgi:hypothetical protein
LFGSFLALPRRLKSGERLLEAEIPINKLKGYAKSLFKLLGWCYLHFEMSFSVNHSSFTRKAVSLEGSGSAVSFFDC